MKKIIMLLFLLFVSVSSYAVSVKVFKQNNKYIEFDLFLDEHAGNYHYISSSRYTFTILQKKINVVRYRGTIVKNSNKDDIFLHVKNKNWEIFKLTLAESQQNFKIKKNVDILVEIDKQKVTYGEGVIVKYSILSDTGFSAYRISKFPEYDGFIKRFIDPGNTTRPIVFEGKNKFITSLYHVELFPIKGQLHKIHNMEIIVNENTPDEFKLISENPNLIYIDLPLDDYYKDVKFSIIPSIDKLKIENNHANIVVKIYGRGMLEHINDLKFLGDNIKAQSIDLVDQKYRPGFGEKKYKIDLEFYENTAGDISLFFGNNIRTSFSIDSFSSVDSSKKVISFDDKLIDKSIPFLKILTLSLSIIYIIALIFPIRFISTFIIARFIFRLWINGFFPIVQYDSLLNKVFKIEKYGFYFNEILIRSVNTSPNILITLRKIKYLINMYGKDQIIPVRISMIEFARLLFFLNKDGKWKF